MTCCDPIISGIITGLLILIVYYVGGLYSKICK